MNVPDKGFNSFYHMFRDNINSRINVPLKFYNFVNLWR